MLSFPVFSAIKLEKTRCFAFFMSLLGSVTFAGTNFVTAQQRPSPDAGCRFGPIRNTSELDDRIASCTITVDSDKSPATVTLALLIRAQNLLDQKRCDLAVADLTRAMEISPSKRDATYNNLHIWIAYYWQFCKGDFDRAIAVLNDAARLFPKDPAAYNERSQVYTEKGEYDLALTDISKAIALSNNDLNRASTYNGRATILRKKGEFDRSIADFSVAIKLAPKNPKYLANRGEVWRLSGNLGQALEDQNRAIELYAGFPGAALGFTLRGETLRYMGRYEEALSDFDQAIRAEPDYAPAYTGRGLTFERLGDGERAKSEFRMALSVSENAGRSDNSKSARDTAEARIAALASGAVQPQFLPAPPRAASATSVPTPTITAPVVVPATPKGRKQGSRVALVIGNSAYTSVPALANPQRDATRIADALTAVGFDTVTLATDVPREKMTDALRSFAAAADKADWAMVYYAGHGIEVNGVNYLIPIDAKLTSDRDVLFAAVPLDQVLAAIDGARKLKVVMLDACRNNPFASASPNPTTALASPPARPSTSPDENRSVKTRSVGRGLGEIKVQGASLVVYAAKHGQTALDGDGEDSPFAVAVVQRIVTPGVEINKLFRLVRDDVMESTAGRQEPYTYGSLPGREDFFFVEK